MDTNDNKNSLEALQKELAKTKAKLDQANQEKAALQEENEAINEQFEELENSLESIDKEHQNTLNELNETKKNLDQANHDNDTAKKTIAKLNKDITASNEELSEIKAAYEIANQDFKTINENLTKVSQEKENLQKNLDQLKNEKIVAQKEWENIKNAKDNEIEKLKEQLKKENKIDKDDEIDNSKIEKLKIKIEKLKTKVTEKEQEIAELIDDDYSPEVIKPHIDEKEAIIKQIENFEKHLNKLLEENENKGNHLVKCQILQKELEKINIKLDKKNDDKQDECCQTINDKLDQLLVDQNEKNMKQLEELNKQIEEKNHIIDELKAKKEKNKDSDDIDQEKENKKINEKITELEKQLEDITKTKVALENKINNNLIFKEQTIGEYNIDKVISLEDFIKNNNIEKMIIDKVKSVYPTAEIDKDYEIDYSQLSKHDIVQGKEIKIIVKPTKNGKLSKEIGLKINLKYKYGVGEQKKALSNILKRAIPNEFWNDRKNINYKAIWRTPARYPKIAEMIQNVRPLPILLNQPHLSSKIMVETFAASYWSNYHTKFWGLWAGLDNGYWKYETVIPSTSDNKKIINVKTLSELNNTYFNKIFLVIEKYLNDSGIKCRVFKKAVKDFYNNWYLYGVGNVKFSNYKINDEDYYDDSNKKRQYYIQVNFDVTFDTTDEWLQDSSQEYAGVVLTLTDELSLYS